MNGPTLMYKSEAKMFVCIDKSIGGIVASDVSLNDACYLLCDGRTIWHGDYPELFRALGLLSNTLRLPDMRDILLGVSFYYIALPPTD